MFPHKSHDSRPFATVCVVFPLLTKRQVWKTDILRPSQEESNHLPVVPSADTCRNPPIHSFTGDGQNLTDPSRTINPLKTKRRLLYLKTSSYRTVNTFHIGYKNRSVYAVSGTSRCLFSDKYKTHNYSVGRTYSC